MDTHAGSGRRGCRCVMIEQGAGIGDVCRTGDVQNAEKGGKEEGKVFEEG